MRRFGVEPHASHAYEVSNAPIAKLHAHQIHRPRDRVAEGCRRTHRIRGNSQASRDVVTVACRKKSGNCTSATNTLDNMMKRPIASQRHYIAISLSSAVCG